MICYILINMLSNINIIVINNQHLPEYKILTQETNKILIKPIQSILDECQQTQFLCTIILVSIHNYYYHYGYNYQYYCNLTNY